MDYTTFLPDLGIKSVALLWHISLKKDVYRTHGDPGSNSFHATLVHWHSHFFLLFLLRADEFVGAISHWINEGPYNLQCQFMNMLHLIFINMLSTMYVNRFDDSEFFIVFSKVFFSMAVRRIILMLSIMQVMQKYKRMMFVQFHMYWGKGVFYWTFYEEQPTNCWCISSGFW